MPRKRNNRSEQSDKPLPKLMDAQAYRRRSIDVARQYLVFCNAKFAADHEGRTLAPSLQKRLYAAALALMFIDNRAAFMALGGQCPTEADLDPPSPQPAYHLRVLENNKKYERYESKYLDNSCREDDGLPDRKDWPIPEFFPYGDEP